MCIRDSPRGSGTGTRSTGASRTGPETVPGPVFSRPCRQLASVPVMSTGPCRWTRRSPVCISMAPPLPAPQGAPQNYKKLGDEEPGDHALGKSTGGMTCKIHLATDGGALCCGPVHLQRQPRLPSRQGNQGNDTRAVRTDRRTGSARLQRRTAPDPSTRKPTKAEMSLNAASTGLNNGVASRPEATKQHATTSLASRSPRP